MKNIYGSSIVPSGRMDFGGGKPGIGWRANFRGPSGTSEQMGMRCGRGASAGGQRAGGGGGAE